MARLGWDDDNQIYQRHNKRPLPLLVSQAARRISTALIEYAVHEHKASATTGKGGRMHTGTDVHALTRAHTDIHTHALFVKDIEDLKDDELQEHGRQSKSGHETQGQPQRHRL